MRVSVDWLREYVKTTASIDRIADRLTMTLTEVDEIHTTKGLAGIMVGGVLAVKAHPHADTLWLTEVEVGSRTYRIVSGADNIAVGDKVPVALPGTALPSGLEISKRRFRGEISEGMLCSARELGVGEDHQGIWLLPSDAKPGQPLSTVLQRHHDTFELDVLANRPDCLGHLGVAREVAAAIGAPFVEPKLNTPSTSGQGAYRAVIKEPNQATRYSLAHLTGLTNGQSPEWLKRRLVAVGMRPINAIVDVTNYVMLEYGQPLHAFDAAKLDGQTITVRRAKHQEPLRTLDGQTRRLPDGTLVIADRRGAIGIAGIIGGTQTEVSEQTTEIVLECAHFDKATVRRTARKLGLRTEASARFEKGISEHLTWPAIRRAVDLITEICGGQLSQLADTYPKKSPSRTIPLDPETLRSFLGVTIAPAVVRSTLTSLGFSVATKGSKLAVKVPDWRSDVTDPVDLYEEVARLYGYDRFPETLPQAELAVPARPPQAVVTDALRDRLAAAGLTEIITHSLVGETLLRKAGFPLSGLVKMANPLSEDHTSLRPSLEPRHLEAITENLRWRDTLSLFEIGCVFQAKRSGLPAEPEMLLVSLATKSNEALLPKARGLLDAIAARFHLHADSFSFSKMTDPRYLPGRQFAITLDGRSVGFIAEIARASGWKARQIVCLGISLEAFSATLPVHWSVKPLPAFPSVYRDLSMFVPGTLAYRDIEQAIKRAGAPPLDQIWEPEEFLMQGRRSITVHLAFTAPDRTLTDNDANQSMKKIVRAVIKLGCQIRE